MTTTDDHLALNERFTWYLLEELLLLLHVRIGTEIGPNIVGYLLDLARVVNDELPSFISLQTTKKI